MSVLPGLGDLLRPRMCQGPVHTPCNYLVQGRPVTDTPEPVPAAYIWTHHDGVEAAVCERCCAVWRQNAEEGRAPQPLRIRSIERGRVYMAAPGSSPDDADVWTEIGYI